jgi:hypothetical protein
MANNEQNNVININKTRELSQLSDAKYFFLFFKKKKRKVVATPQKWSKCHQILAEKR